MGACVMVLTVLSSPTETTEGFLGLSLFRSSITHSNLPTQIDGISTHEESYRIKLHIHLPEGFHKQCAL
jgi:hypothetical protein